MFASSTVTFMGVWVTPIKWRYDVNIVRNGTISVVFVKGMSVVRPLESVKN